MSVQQELVYLCRLCKCCLRADQFAEHECSASNVEIFEHFDEQPAQSEDSVTEVLIGLVQNKTPLWDHRLPISQRGKNEKDKLWSEIWKEMGGILPIENLQKKWKNLRDQFMKTKAQVDTYVPSGSDANIPSKKKVWKHYESLKFLKDTVQPKKTSSNLKGNIPMLGSPLSLNLSEESSASLPDMPSPASSSGLKRRRKQENFEESLIKILDKPIQLPVPAPQQQLSPSMVMASSLLEKLPMRVRMKAERDFINKLYDLVDEYIEQ